MEERARLTSEAVFKSPSIVVPRRPYLSRIGVEASLIICLLSCYLPVYTYSASNLTDQQAIKPTPLIYTRLRFDYGALPILAEYQKELPIDETHKTIEDTLENGKRVVHSYYVNPDVDVNSLEEDDLVVSALHQTYLSRLYQMNILEYDNPDDRRRAADPQKVDFRRCNRELDYLMWAQNKLAREKGRGRAPNAELLNFFGAFGAEEAGYLLGNHYWIGDSTQCAMRHIFDLNPPTRQHPTEPKVISFSGRYCVASIRSSDWDAKIERKANNLSEFYFKLPNQRIDYERFFRFQVGLCLPESCDSSVIDTRTHDIRKLALHHLREPFKSYNLTHLFCLPDESSELRQLGQSGRLLVILSTFWVASLILASIIDYYDLLGTNEKIKAISGSDGKSSRAKAEVAAKSFIQHIVVALSLCESYKKFVRIRAHEEEKNRTPNKQDEASVGDLLFLQAIKVLTMPFIVLGHACMNIHQINKYPLSYDIYPDFLYNLNVGIIFTVDWYFCITGFIIVYASFASNFVHTATRGQWWYSIFHRYWRLAPSYILLFWFCQSIFQYTGHGPLWDYATSSFGIRANCQRESLWNTITLTTNLHPLYESCIASGWYVSSDMQFYLITPFLLLLLAKSSRLGWLTIMGGIVGCISARYARYMTDSQARHVDLLHIPHGLVMRTQWDMSTVYVNPQYRIASYLIGLLAGHYCYMVRSGKWRSPLYNNGGGNKSSRTSNYLPILTALLGVSLMAGFFMPKELFKHFPRSLERQARYFSAPFYAIHHTLSGTGIALLITVFILGRWTQLRKIMEHPYWTYLARINFFVYLYQIELLTWLQDNARRKPEGSALEIFCLFMLAIPLIYFIAFVATIALGNPLARLEQELLAYFSTKRRHARQS